MMNDAVNLRARGRKSKMQSVRSYAMRGRGNCDGYGCGCDGDRIRYVGETEEWMHVTTANKDARGILYVRMEEE